MRIGIVSKPQHCKNHIRRLAAEGYEVECLGGNPNTIPPGVELVVLRTDSCSHGASDTVFKWKRDTQRPIVVENGFSGILKALKEIHPQNEAPTTMTTTYTGPDTPIPTNVSWSSHTRIGLLHKALSEAKAILNALDDTTRKAILEAYTNPEGFKGIKKGSAPSWLRPLYGNKRPSFSQSVFRGKPRTFTMFLTLLIKEPPVKVRGADLYHKLTGKMLDISNLDACVWFLAPMFPDAQMSYAPGNQKGKKPKPKRNVVAMHTPESKPVEIRDDQGYKYIDVSPAAVESNTSAILEVLEEMERLAAKVKALEDFRNTQGPVGSEWEARIENQIKVLQVGQAEMLRQAVEETSTSMSAMKRSIKDEMRADIANAFDQLAIDHEAKNTASPFQAINDFKAALKAAGFQGTLTLTIE